MKRLIVYLFFIFSLGFFITNVKAVDPVTNVAISEGVPIVFDILKSAKDKAASILDKKKEKKEIKNRNENQKLIGSFICISEEQGQLNYFMAKNLDECNFDKHSNFKYLVFQDKNPKEFQFLNHYNSRHGSKPLSYKVLSEMIGDDFRKKFLAKNSDISLIKNGVNKSLVKLKEEQEKFIDENSDLFIDFAGKKITKVEYCRTINKKIKNSS